MNIQEVKTADFHLALAFLNRAEDDIMETLRSLADGGFHDAAEQYKEASAKTMDAIRAAHACVVAILDERVKELCDLYGLTPVKAQRVLSDTDNKENK